MRLQSLRREVLGFYSQQLRNRSKPRQNQSCAQHVTTFKRQVSSTPDWTNSCTKLLRIQGQQQMPPFLSVPEKSLPMGCVLREGLHDTQNLSEFSAHPSKPFRGRTPHSLLSRFKLLNKCRPGQRTGQGTTTSLILQSSSERS